MKRTRVRQQRLVLGSRKLKESKRRGKGKIPFYRSWGQFVLMICSYTIAKKKYSDSESGFRALSRRAMEAMKFEKAGFFVETEMLYLVEKKGLKTTEVPITEIYRCVHCTYGIDIECAYEVCSECIKFSFSSGFLIKRVIRRRESYREKNRKFG